VHKPAIAFITLGANDVFHLEGFEPQMRKIIEYSISQGVIPILSTKPDNIEKNHQINQTIARLAYEYQIPLWNYWKAVQALPDHGLQEDGVHITFKANQFENPDNLQAGWPVRNLTALQVLDDVLQFIIKSPEQ
jgi:lysophospholipase L1-like esterase